MSNQYKQTLVAGAAVPAPGVSQPAPAAAQPEVLAEGSAVTRIAEEFDALTAAMLPESLDAAESEWQTPDLTGLDGNIVLCDLSGGGEEAVAEPAAAAAPADEVKRPLTMGIPKFDEEPELELDVDVPTAAPQAPPPTPAPAQQIARGSGSHGAAPPPVPAAHRARATASRQASPAAAPAPAATPPPIPAQASASFSTEFARGGASVHTFPIVRAGFILAGLAVVCAVTWYFVLAP